MTPLVIEHDDYDFVWNRSHTVNIYLRIYVAPETYQRREIDVLSIGDFSQDRATLDDFEQAVADYVAEQNGYDDASDAYDPDDDGWHDYNDDAALMEVY